MKFSTEDIRQMQRYGITAQQATSQLEQLRQGFPFLKLQCAACVGRGIISPAEEERKQYVQSWKRYKEEDHKIVKFVPASGAASRMFKDLYAFAEAPYDAPQTSFEKHFFANIRKFAFRKDLCTQCKKNENKNVCTLNDEGNYKAIVRNLLTDSGLNYGQLPKGLLLFHNYEDGPRTPVEEHLVEAALYASTRGKAAVHFTVSPQHLELFKDKIAQVKEKYESHFNVKFNITFSQQKASTDTIAAKLDGTPFRKADGSLLFRPGGHGALIENLNEIDADIVFIKNIDNVVPDRLKEDTTQYKQMLAGILVTLQQRAFDYLRLLDAGNTTNEQLTEILHFVENTLCCHSNKTAEMDTTELTSYLKKKLDRPMRVCGMVKNVGEPGGGPFLAFNPDGTVSPQILESTQIDLSRKEYQKMFEEGTHFNPVDLVCSLRNYKGEAFRLQNFIDEQTGFISHKSKDGEELLALELPGLWNGAMSDWSTVFAEVPLTTFNPVKTVNDLLREQHQ